MQICFVYNFTSVLDVARISYQSFISRFWGQPQNEFFCLTNAWAQLNSEEKVIDIVARVCEKE